MFFKIVVLLFLALGTVFAQQAKPKRDYFCSAGVAIFPDEIDHPPAKNKWEAADAECLAEYKQSMDKMQKMRQEDETRRQELNKQIAELDARYEKNVREGCELRDTYTEDGTDDPLCKGIPPRLDVLETAHRVCGDKRTSQILIVCDRLLPLSMGKAYPPKTPPATKK